MLCQVCEELQSKYRCPKCLIRYCTVQCFKNHKKNSCPEKKAPSESREDEITKVSEVQNKVNALETDDKSEDRVGPEMLNKLVGSPELLHVLKNPHLQNIITHLDSSNQPSIDMEVAMQEPIFTEFVDQCLKIVEPRKITLDHT